MPITRCLKPDSIKGQDNRVNSNTEIEVRELLALRRGPAESSSNRISIALSIDDAYHVQAKVLRLLNESVGGWKVAIGPEEEGHCSSVVGVDDYAVRLHAIVYARYED